MVRRYSANLRLRAGGKGARYLQSGDAAVGASQGLAFITTLFPRASVRKSQVEALAEEQRPELGHMVDLVIRRLECGRPRLPSAYPCGR